MDIDLMEVVREAERLGHTVEKLCAYCGGTGDIMFALRFEPVKPYDRKPVEMMLRRLGFEVTGGGTGIRREGDKNVLSYSDVTFRFPESKQDSGDE